ncbi:MAG: glycosyltransferase family 39 protein [Deltaproteobacteria bacterium]|nr:glycosyltransferase family 39 protein [Deltaproteobacteria bacterium]
MYQNKGRENAAKYNFIFISGLCLLFFITRFYKLHGLPIFTDESTYIRWAQIIAEEPSQFLLSLNIDGKQPLFHWINALTVKLFNNPLTSIRVISVFSGFLSALALYHIARLLHSNGAGILALALYIFTPYMLIHDRIGIAASLLSLFITYTLLICVIISRRGEGSGKWFLLLGLFLTAAFLTKTTALLYFLLLPAVIFILGGTRGVKNNLYYFMITYLVAFLIIAVINLGGSSPHERNPLFYQKKYFLTARDLLSFPLHLWWKNAAVLVNYLYSYLTPFIFWVVAFSVFFVIKYKKRDYIALFLWFLFPLMVLMLIGQILFSRYIVFAIPSALVIASISMLYLREKLFVIFHKFPFRGLWANGVISLFFIPMLILDYGVIMNPVKAAFIPQDHFQYVSGWPSGYGISEAAQYLKEKAKEQPITLFLTTMWGHPNDSLIINLRNERNIRIYEAHWWYKAPIVPGNVGYAQMGKSKYLKVVEGTLDFSELKETYFATDSEKSPEMEFLGQNRNFYKVASFFKPGKKYSVDIYKLRN